MHVHALRMYRRVPLERLHQRSDIPGQRSRLVPEALGARPPARVRGLHPQHGVDDIAWRLRGSEHAVRQPHVERILDTEHQLRARQAVQAEITFEGAVEPHGRVTRRVHLRDRLPHRVEHTSFDDPRVRFHAHDHATYTSPRPGTTVPKSSERRRYSRCTMCGEVVRSSLRDRDLRPLASGRERRMLFESARRRESLEGLRD